VHTLISAVMIIEILLIFSVIIISAITTRVITIN
jgi:hypothetical protein